MSDKTNMADQVGGQVDENGNLIETLKCKHDKTDTEVPKKKKYLQSYKESYSVLWPCLRQSKRGEHMVFCSVCNRDFSCGHIIYWKKLLFQACSDLKQQQTAATIVIACSYDQEFFI